MLFVLCAAMSVTLGASSLTPPPAEAAFPGRNGRIVVEALAGAVEPNGVVDDYDIFTVGPDGASLQRVTSGPEADFNPIWSPNSQQIAFARALPFARAADIYVMDADGSGLVNLTNTPLDDEYAPDWSPDGKRIAFTRASLTPVPGFNPLNTDVFVMDVDGSNVAAMVEGPGHQAHPAWSPDGSLLAYHDSPTKSIVLIRSDGSDRLVLEGSAAPGGQAFSPEWSPDGRFIAFHSAGQGVDIWIIRPDGTGLRNLTATDSVAESFPAWSPDGERLVFIRQQEDTFGLFAMRATGGKIRRLIDLTLGFAVKPDWGRRTLAD